MQDKRNTKPVRSRQADAGERIVSVNTAIFDGYDWPFVFAEIAAAGATHVEPSFTAGYSSGYSDATFSLEEACAFRSGMAAAGLSCFSVSSHIDLGAEDAVSVFRRRMVFAAEVGARVIISNTTQESRRASFLDNMAQLIPEAEKSGLVIGLENPGNGSGSLLHSGESARAVVKAIGSPAVRVNFDIGNIRTYHRGARVPAEELADCLDVVVHLHLKDVMDSGDGWRFCAIGDGDVDWEPVFSLLHERAPGLPLAIETPLRLRRPHYSDPYRAPEREPLDAIRSCLRRSFEFVADA